MNTIRIVTKNILSLTAANIISRLLTAIVGILIVRYLGAEQFGQYSAALAYVTMFMVLMDFGLSQLLVREGSRNKKIVSALLGNTLCIFFLCSLICYFLMILLSHILNYSDITHILIIILGINIILSAGKQILNSIFQIFQHLELTAIITTISSTLTLIIILEVIHLDLGLKAIVFSMVIVGIIGTVLFLLLSFKFTKPVFNLKRTVFIIKEGHLFGLTNLFYILYFQLPIVILSQMLTDSDVGYYSAAFKLVIIFTSISPLIFNQSLLPLLYKYSNTNKEKLKVGYKINSKYMLLFGIPLSIGIFLLAPEIIGIAFGNQYNNSIIVLRILCWIIPIRYLASSVGSILTSIDRLKNKVIVQVLVVAISISLNIVLIPKYGYVGVGIASLITEIIILVTYYIMVSKYLYRLSFIKDLRIFNQLLAIFFMTCFCLIVRKSLNIWLNVIISATIYIISLVIFNYFDDYDRNIIKKLLFKN